MPPRTPIVRLAERRFAVLLHCDSMSGVLDQAVSLTEDHPPEIESGSDKVFVDVTLGIAVCPSHVDDAETLFCSAATSRSTFSGRSRSPPVVFAGSTAPSRPAS